MIKRIAYLGSSAVCGFGSWSYLYVGLRYKSASALAVSGGLGVASLEMGKKAFKRKEEKKCDCSCENCKCKAK